MWAVKYFARNVMRTFIVPKRNVHSAQMTIFTLGNVAHAASSYQKLTIDVISITLKRMIPTVAIFKPYPTR